MAGARRGITDRVSPLSTSPRLHDDDSNQSKSLKDLTIKLPGLSEKEVSFLQQQVAIILRPDCLKPSQDSNVEGSNAKPTLQDPTTFERVFPSTTGMRNMVACCNQIAKVYPDFKVPRRLTDRYGRNLTSPILSQRVAEGLFLCGVKKYHLAESPSLVLYKDCGFYNDAELAQIADLSLSKMIDFSKGKTPLRGNFIHAYMDKVCQTLEELGLSEEATDIDNINFSQLSEVTLRDIYSICNKTILERIQIRESLDVDVGEIIDSYKKNQTGSPKSPIAVARNYYIQETLLNLSSKDSVLKTPETRLKLYLKPDPLESLVSLNSLHETVSDLDSSYNSKEKFLEEVLGVGLNLIRLPPHNLPVSIRRQLLQDIGFTNKEIVEILLSKKCLRFSDKSTDLFYTSSSYPSTMKSRLTLLRTEGPNLGLVDLSDYWAAMVNWGSIMQDMGQIIDNKATGKVIKPSYDGDKIKIASNLSLPSKQTSHPTIKFLAKYFGLTSSEEVTQLKKSIFPSVVFPSVPMSRIHTVLARLTARGFTKEQIKRATPLLCYPPSLVEQKLDEISSNHDTENVNFLHVCLYYIEREFNFTAEGLFAGVQTDHYSRELLQEIDRHRRPQKVERDSDDHFDEEEDVESLHFPSPRDVRMAGCLQANARLFSSATFSGSPENFFIQRRLLFHNRSLGIVLQNPVDWLQVQFNFQKIKEQWDPSFKKKEFLQGTKHVGSVCCDQHHSQQLVR